MLTALFKPIPTHMAIEHFAALVWFEMCFKCKTDTRFKDLIFQRLKKGKIYQYFCWIDIYEYCDTHMNMLNQYFDYVEINKT